MTDLKRPTCETCPYWHQEFNSSIWPECRRNPPRDGSFPLADLNDFCGEHPDFPAYIESQKGKDDE